MSGREVIPSDITLHHLIDIVQELRDKVDLLWITVIPLAERGEKLAERVDRHREKNGERQRRWRTRQKRGKNTEKGKGIIHLDFRK